MEQTLETLEIAPSARKLSFDSIAIFIAIYGGAILCFWHVNRRAVLLALLAHFVLGFGTTLGLHRLLTHRCFKTYHWVRRTLAVMGTLNLGGGVLEWVAVHRMHHADTDGDSDPHSAADGFFIVYMGWFLWRKRDCFERQRLLRFARDIAADPFMLFISRRDVQVGVSVVWFLLLYFTFDLPAALWCVCGRLALNHQTTFLVNSICHTWGYRNFATPDRSTNSRIMALFAIGEGWHNNHHFDPDAASTTRRPGEFDFTYQVIRGLEWLGLAWDIVPPKPFLDQLQVQQPAASVANRLW